MRSVQQTPPLASVDLFTASKPVRFLKTLKCLRFSGQLVFTSSKGQQWTIYLCHGEIAYATGVTHSMRRWRRNLSVYCPQMASQPAQWVVPSLPSGGNAAALTSYWEYQLLSLWVMQQKIAPAQAAQMIRAIVLEVLFDVAQAMRIVHQINQDHSLSTPLVLIDINEAIAEVQLLWQSWQNALLADFSPNTAPIIKHSQGLKERTSTQLYQTLSRLLDGEHTLRDLAVLMKRDVLQVTRSLLPYIRSGVVELDTIPDLPTPVSAPVVKMPVVRSQLTQSTIACVDDSPLVCQTMESLLVAAGYQFVGVNDPLRALAILLARKPDLIFLDLVMPNTNGYEICSQLRKVSHFRNTPIVILTGKDGIVDRVRAKLVGASDFLSKPIDAGVVLGVIRKHLKQGAISH